MDISIEVTRRCNLKCLHCMRGNAQNIEMGKEVIKALKERLDEVKRDEIALRQMRYLRCVTITGGEPFLNPFAVKEITKMLSEMDVEVFMYTNGTIPIDDKVATAIGYVMSSTLDRSFSLPIALSSEKHKRLYPAPLREWEFARSKKEVKQSNELLYIGRAIENESELYEMGYVLDEKTWDVSTICILAGGKIVIHDGDYSYNEIDEEAEKWTTNVFTENILVDLMYVNTLLDSELGGDLMPPQDETEMRNLANFAMELIQEGELDA